MSQHRTLRDAVWACQGLSSSAKIVALRLVEHWPRIMPSVASIAEFTGLSVRAAQYALRELEERDVVRTSKRKGARSTYEFVGVSIPDLGTPAESAPPPLHQVHHTPAESAPPTPAESAPEADNSKADKKAGARKRGPLSHFVPSEWSPKQTHRDEHKALGAAWFERELKKFRCWEFKTPRSDWDRAFSNWLGSASERNDAIAFKGRASAPADDGEWA